MDMVCEVELDGDIEAISVLGNIMRIKVKGTDNIYSLGGGGAMRGVVVWWGKFGNVKSSWGSGSKTSRGWNRLRESIVASVLGV